MTRLLVTVDTEEEGLWAGTYRPTGNTVDNILGIARFQATCERHGVRPTYLVDAPVVQDDRAVEILRPIQEDGRGEVGAHLHPWCNPPLETRELGPADSFLCNLSPTVQRAKLEWLTEAIGERFGRRPTSFRAGRYGLDAIGLGFLAELGYEVDSSVIPFSDYSAEGGPNFHNVPHTPYFPDLQDLRRPGQRGAVLEVPVSVGFNRTSFVAANRLLGFVGGRLGRLCRSEGILDRLGIVRRIKFSPEQSDSNRMNRLVSAFVAQRSPAIVMLVHSSSLLPGHSPYARTAGDVERLYVHFEATLAACRRRGMQAITLSEFAREWPTTSTARNRAHAMNHAIS